MFNTGVNFENVAFDFDLYQGLKTEYALGSDAKNKFCISIIDHSKGKYVLMTQNTQF